MAQMQVFVSHSHKNNAFCAELVHALREAGADVWYDDESLHTGQLGPVIERELRERPVFIVALSPAALASQWVEDETRWAYNRLRRDPTRIILPVIAEPLADEDDIWLFLQDFRRIGATGVMPYPLPEAVSRTLHALQLTRPGEAPLPTTPQPSESVDDLLAQGKALIAQDKYAEAIPFFERASQRDPRSFDAWANLGFAYGELGRHGDGLAACDRALALDATQAWVWINKGAVLNDLKRYAEALAAYDRVLALDPNYADAWRSKGLALYNLQRYEEALAAYDRALALDATQAWVWNAKGYVYRALGKPEEGLRLIDHAISLAPSDGNFWDSRGDMLLALGHYQEALAAYEAALELMPTLTVSWHNKAAALRGLGRTAEAEEAERRATELGS